MIKQHELHKRHHIKVRKRKGLNRVLRLHPLDNGIAVTDEEGNVFSLHISISNKLILKEEKNEK
jgi:hypothetical protein